MDSIRHLWHAPTALHRLSSLLFLLSAVALLAGTVHWLASRPAFALRTVEVQAVGAPLRHVQEADLRLALAGGLQGTTLTAPLGMVQGQLASHPWVRQVSIRRIWPNRLLVRLEEHQPMASWEDGRFFNRQGELFLGEESAAHEDARVVYGCRIPSLSGPVGSASRVLERALAVDGMTASAKGPGPGLSLLSLTLTPHFSWQMKLSSEVSIELGRDSLGTDWRTRLGLFLESHHWLVGGLGRDSVGLPIGIDLRYANGYAYQTRPTDRVSVQATPRVRSTVSCLRHFQQGSRHDT